MKFIQGFHLFFLFVTAGYGQTPVPARQPLNQNWTFSWLEKSYTATVPGCIHTDLHDNGLIPDPFTGTADSSLQWIGKKSWTYSCTFDVNTIILEKEQVELTFKGLDTYASVFLNDSLILKADNMFRSWTVSCKRLLFKKHNRLRIEFESAENKSTSLYQQYSIRLPGEERVMTRKAQFQYGWDFSPRYLTCGIWKEVTLNGWDRFTIREAVLQVDSVKNRFAFLSQLVTLQANEGGTFQFSLKNRQTGEVYGRHIYEVKKGSNEIVFTAGIDEPKEWWCNGYGEPFLYRMRLEVNGPKGFTDAREFDAGIRTIELVEEPDSLGTGFYFRLNGKPVFMKGANVVPASVFPSSVTTGYYDSLLQDAVVSHFNMLRVWGGGIYESDAFYRFCDEKGILIWQDFMFACGMYPFDRDFLDNVKTEAREQVARLGSHPCLALFCGNNEISEGWQRWGWRDGFTDPEKKRIEAGYQELFREILPQAVRYYTNLPYWESSPSLGRGDPLHTTRGDAHNWFVWHDRQPFENYIQRIPRFMSEFGFQSYPSLYTLRQLDTSGASLRESVIQFHQKNKSGNEIIREYLATSYGIPETDSNFVYLSQVQQAEGIALGMEAHRRNKPSCMGSLYWQYNDSWPSVSWSSRDYYGRWKALQYFARRALNTFAVSMVSEKDSMAVHILSDTIHVCTGTLMLRGMQLNGKETADTSLRFVIHPDRQTIFKFPKWKFNIQNADSAHFLLEAMLCVENKLAAEKIYYFCKTNQLYLEKPLITLSVKPHKKGMELQLRTDKPVKNVWLSARADVHFSDNFFDMLPGRNYSVFCNNIFMEQVKSIRITSIFETR